MAKKTVKNQTAVNVGIAWNIFDVLWEQYKGKHGQYGVPDNEAKHVLQELPDVVKGFASLAVATEKKVKL